MDHGCGGQVCGVVYCMWLWWRGVVCGVCTVGQGKVVVISTSRLVVRNTLVTDVRVAARTFLRAWTEFIARLLQVPAGRKVRTGNKHNSIVKACFLFQAFSYPLSPDQLLSCCQQCPHQYPHPVIYQCPHPALYQCPHPALSSSPSPVAECRGAEGDGEVGQGGGRHSRKTTQRTCHPGALQCSAVQ